MTGKDEQAQVEAQLSPLANASFPLEDEVRAEEQRKRIVSNLRPLVGSARFQRRRRSQRLAGGVALLAAAAAAAVWFRPTGTAPDGAELNENTSSLALIVEGTEAEVAHASGVAQIPAGAPSELQGVKRVSTPGDSTARIEVLRDAPQAGLNIVAGPDSELAITRTSENSGLEQLYLSRGHVDVKVPKLKAGASFIIATPSIRVAVVGTAFSLTVAPELEQDSCLRVSEGVVRVEDPREPHAEIATLNAGQDWGCLEKTSDANSIAPPAEKEGRSARKLNPKASAKAAPPAGTLAEETALLARAVRASQQENHIQAERELNQLLKKYPDSALAAEAKRLRKQVREALSK